MPHIRIIRTGRTYHDIDSTIASLFCESGLAEYFTPVQLGSKQASRPTVPTFAVIFNSDRNKFELVCTLPSGAVQRFDGLPHLAKTAFQSLAWSGEAQARIMQGPQPPASILSEYAHAYGLPQAEANAFVQSKQKALEANEAAKWGVRAGQ